MRAGLFFALAGGVLAGAALWLAPSVIGWGALALGFGAGYLALGGLELVMVRRRLRPPARGGIALPTGTLLAFVGVAAIAFGALKAPSAWGWALAGFGLAALSFGAWHSLTRARLLE